MGFGDPCHKHNLKFSTIPGDEEWYDDKRQLVTINCFHCKLKIEGYDGYSCSRCDYWVHFSCIELPQIVIHPLHPLHSLTLVCDEIDTTNTCNECQTLCIGGSYSYQCHDCRFSLHTKCFFTHTHEKHHHPLSFSTSKDDQSDCRICGYPVYDSNFGCSDCGFFIHHDCSLVPSIVKHHHVHELTIRHNFPDECNQVYCDICEDRDGELDRTLSYYYCKKCDYIAHVRCATQQNSNVFLVERYTHEHPLRIVRDPMERENNSFKLGCDKCDEVFDDKSLEFPYLIKHPLHPEHTLTWLFDVDDGLFKCRDCEFSLPLKDAMKFTHPLVGDCVVFVCNRILFGCDACGELGKGSRMYDRDLDFHLECFALPGKLNHESHVHPLYLLSLDTSTYHNCNICNEEIDQKLWKYYCRRCDYVAHLNCVANGLLSTLRSFIKNEPHFCAIVEPEKSSFEFQITNLEPPDILEVPSPRHYSSSGCIIYLQGERKSKHDVQHGKANCGTDMGLKEVSDALCCPKCNGLISTPPKCSDIKDWESIHFTEFETIVNNPSQCKSEPLTVLSEQQIDDLYCPICSVLIFPPTYSCSSCQIYFHKSCANLPRKITLLNLPHVLVEPPFPDSLPSCYSCKYSINGYAYVSSDGRTVFDVQCSLVAPLIKQVIDEHFIVCYRNTQEGTMCKACGTSVDVGAPLFVCVDEDCYFSIHVECALLPHVIQHKIHKHPLELVYDLSKLDDEYICDVCEKELNPNLAAYRCVDTCKGYSTSHVTCVTNSRKKCHFTYGLECQDMPNDQKLAFKTTTEVGARKYGIPWHGYG